MKASIILYSTMIYGFILISALLTFPAFNLMYQNGIVQALTVISQLLDKICALRLDTWLKI